MSDDYTKTPFEEQVRLIAAEAGVRRGEVDAAQRMWADCATQLGVQLDRLADKKVELSNAWTDGTFPYFGEKLEQGRIEMLNWTGPIEDNAVVAALTDLSQLIGDTAQNFAVLAEKYDRGKAAAQQAGQTFDDTDYQRSGGCLLNQLATRYEAVGAALGKVRGPDWSGRRVMTPPPAQTSPQAGPDDTTARAPAGTPGGEAPRNPSAPQQPDDQPSRQQDPAEDALAAAPGAVDALSQAMQSLDGLLGGGSDLTSSPGDYNPADLAAMTPEDYGKYLDQLNAGSVGLPTLAGLAGAGGLGVGGAALGGTPGIPAIPSADGATSVAGLGATVGGTAAAASAVRPGMMPPMYPARTAGRQGSGGVNPGAAEETGSVRKRKTTGTPGVPLRGRAGKTKPRKGSVAKPSEPAPQRRREPVTELLDEELWQLNPEENEPQEGTWPATRSTATPRR